MTDLVVRSNTEGDSLVIAADVADYWRATIEAKDLTASIRFRDPYLGFLRDYFAKLGEDWRGWTDERVWRSCENDVRLTALHDGVGTVTLTVQLRTGPWQRASDSRSAPGFARRRA